MTLGEPSLWAALIYSGKKPASRVECTRSTGAKRNEMSTRLTETQPATFRKAALAAS